MAEVIVVSDEEDGILDARTLWRPKYLAEKQARKTAEAQTTQLQTQYVQLRAEAAREKLARETAEAQTTQLQTAHDQLRTEAAREKLARETAEAQTTQLQTELVQLRAEAAREKLARETAEAQTTQLQTAHDQLRTEAARENLARETAEAQTTQLQTELVQLRAEAAREKLARETAEAQTTQLQTAHDQLRTEAARENLARETAEAQTTQLQTELVQLREELTLAATAQAKQEKDIAMAHERLAQELAIAAGTQLQKEQAVMMEVQAQGQQRLCRKGYAVTAIDDVAAFTQASLDAPREERCTFQFRQLGQHRDRATEGSSDSATSKASLLPGCDWMSDDDKWSPPASPRQKDDGLGVGENLPAAAMSPTLAISTPHAPGARAFKVDGPGNVVADSQFQEATTIELHFDAPYMFQRGKLGKGDEGGRNNTLPCDDAMVASKTVVIVCDGVSAGGSSSGELARAFATTAYSRASNGARMMAEEFRSPLEEKSVTDILKRSPKASTTVTMLKLHNQRGCSFIESIEVGDSQWALLRRGEDSKWKCTYISVAQMYKAHTSCPLQLDINNDIAFFLKNNVSGHTICNRVHVKSGDIVIAASDGLWDNLNDGVGLLQDRSQKSHKLEEFFNNEYRWWDKNKDKNKDKGKVQETFVSFVGRSLRNEVTSRMEGPEISSSSNQRTKKLDDVTFFVGMINELCQVSSHDDCEKSPTTFLFASNKLDHKLISRGLEFDSSTTKEYVEAAQALTQRIPKPEEDRFEGYKVDMCRNPSTCVFGDRCIFAHHAEELRCKYWTRHACQDGDKCLRQHATTDPSIARAALEKYEKAKAKRSLANFPQATGGPVAKRTKF